MKRILSIFFLMLALISPNNLFCQDWQQQLDDYKQFLNQHQNLTIDELLNMHPAGLFLKTINSTDTPLYLDSLILKFGLTEYEKSLISKHGFVVTERLRNESFGAQLAEVWHKDLPLFISTDAILHAFHMSYDAMLKEIELKVIIPKLQELLTAMCEKISVLNEFYASEPGMSVMLKDVDFYLTVPRKIFDPTVNCFFAENNLRVDEYILYINQQIVRKLPFLADSNSRFIDFSQFKPRGHYADEEYPILAKYFQAMMWLGRMEIYLLAPESIDNNLVPQDIQRQIIDSYLISELIEQSNKIEIVNEIESTIAAFVGEQDNVTFTHLGLLKAETGFTKASDLLNEETINSFQSILRTKSFAYQRILSQILMGDAMTPGVIQPASAFMLFGQRFVVDSYVTGNVVYDKINFNGAAIMRMLPSTLDILFSIGNDAVAQLLSEELDTYKYSTNLAALRYLIDGYDNDFWDLSIYNSWLNSIRTLNPVSESERVNLPEFMQTAAWWQQKINTQLSAWTELRHDNLLYAKQSYTGGVICSYPYVFVEPIPEFYESMSLLADLFKEKINNLSFVNGEHILWYLEGFKCINDTLGIIAHKELNMEHLTEKEISFLKKILFAVNACGQNYAGWYPDLFYFENEKDMFKNDFLVADYHTAPTDEFGGPVGWVAHAGTGPIDMAIVTAHTADGKYIAFSGPVMSYDEYTTTNFLRLTDEEWKASYQAVSLRPDWVNLYLADKQGVSRGAGTTLLTGIEDENGGEIIPQTHLIAANYPNPFNAGTIINYTIPHGIEDYNTQLVIYDIQGQAIKKLVDKELTPGNYLTRWDATNEFNSPVASGIYFYVLRVGAERFTGKMNLMK
ncbi:MAG: DUF3160 domain-containing protein [bacterium]